MSFMRARSAGLEISAVEATGSTNADMLARAADFPHLGVIVTLDQTAGRGRLDRTWVAPPGMTLAASVMLRVPALAGEGRGWLPLVAGLAMRDAITDVVPPAGRVRVKWPNDVLVDDAKVCGILAQVAADGSVVMGAGVNLTIPAADLPTPTSTSLAIVGARGTAPDLADRVLTRFVPRLGDLVDALVTGGAAAGAARDAVRAACDSIDRRVRVELPGGAVLAGRAEGIDDTGALLVRADAAGGSDGLTAISVGDVTHLRYE